MTHHLEPVPVSPQERDDALIELDLWIDDATGNESPVRRRWWRLVALIVALALVVATPFAYALAKLLD